MICVSIVEDEAAAAEKLKEFLKKYSEKNNVLFNTTVYTDGESFLSNYKSDVDIVFMDIELPDSNGMEISAKLRELDQLVTIVFVTNMQQFAAKGYSVGAADFIVKPITYYAFSSMLNRIMHAIVATKTCELTIKTVNGIRRVSANAVSLHRGLLTQTCISYRRGRHRKLGYAERVRKPQRVEILCARQQLVFNQPTLRVRRGRF